MWFTSNKGVQRLRPFLSKTCKNPSISHPYFTLDTTHFSYSLSLRRYFLAFSSLLNIVCRTVLYHYRTCKTTISPCRWNCSVSAFFSCPWNKYMFSSVTSERLHTCVYSCKHLRRRNMSSCVCVLTAIIWGFRPWNIASCSAEGVTLCAFQNKKLRGYKKNKAGFGPQ